MVEFNLVTTDLDNERIRDLRFAVIGEQSTKFKKIKSPLNYIPITPYIIIDFE